MPNAPKQRTRTCIACGAKADKTELTRIVRSPEGTVSLDRTGRAAGRGAYVCSAACMAAAAKGKKLQRALRVNIEHDEVERLVRELGEPACEEGRR